MLKIVLHIVGWQRKEKIMMMMMSSLLHTSSLFYREILVQQDHETGCDKNALDGMRGRQLPGTRCEVVCKAVSCQSLRETVLTACGILSRIICNQNNTRNIFTVHY